MPSGGQDRRADAAGATTILPASPHDDTVEGFAKFFPPNPIKHGRLTAVVVGENKKKAHTVEGRVTPAALGTHLAVHGREPGYRSLGYLPGDATGTVVGAIDIDSKDYGDDPALIAAAWEQVLKLCAHEDLAAYSERSTRGKGWHVWLWTDTPLPYRTMRMALRAIVRKSGLAGTTETYPMGDDASGRWIFMPYDGALDPKGNRLGRTYLIDSTEQPIPVDELDDWITLNPSERVEALAAEQEQLEAKNTRATAPVKQDASTHEFSSDAVDILLEVATTQAPPSRHDALAAFLNVGSRAGALPEMAEGLKTSAVWSVWCPDGSRSHSEWTAEIDRWVANIAAGNATSQRGLPYLREIGYEIPSLPAPIRERPQIITTNRQLRDLTAEALQALIQNNSPKGQPELYQRAGELVRVTKRGSEVTRAEALTRSMLLNELTRKADFWTVRVTKGVEELRAVIPGDHLAESILAQRAEDLPFPELRMIATTPTYTQDGKLISEDGYHESGILLDLRGLKLPPLPSVDHALGLLRNDLLGDFPFADPEPGFAHTLAALLTPLVRVMISGPTPLTLINAPTQGTGKGLLMEVIALIATGEDAPIGVKTNDTELEKRITAKLLSGQRLILLDNVEKLGGQILAAALTAKTWSGRELGRSRDLNLPNDASWLATGNNPEFDAEIPRRTIPIRLDARMERPETRGGFRHPNLTAWVRQERPALLAACIALIENWIAKGQPHPTIAPNLGSFESWREVVGGVLEAAGVPGFLEGREVLHQGIIDGDTAEWGLVFERLHLDGHTEWLRAKDIASALQEFGLCTELWDGEKPASITRKVGRALMRIKDRVIGDYRLVTKEDKNLKIQVYRVENVQLDRAEYVDL